MSKQSELLNLTNGLSADIFGNVSITKSLAIGNNFSQNSQTSMSGGGDITYSAGYLKWTTRFIAIGNGIDPGFAYTGYFDITLPEAGSVIKGLGTTPDRVCTASGIPMTMWEALWYILPLSGVNTSLAPNFRLGRYQDINVAIPNHWILVATTNGDAGKEHVKTCSGRNVPSGTTSYLDTGFIVPALINGWASYDSTYAPVRYSRKSNVVSIIGLVKNGAISTDVFILPVGFRPTIQQLGATTTDPNVHGRLDVRPDGGVSAAIGSNVWFSVACSFVAI
jgi:hypothetical protein